MGQLKITGVTISVDFGQKEYGTGTNSFMNMKAEASEGIPIEQMDDVVNESLDMFAACWRTLLLGKIASSQLKGTEGKEQIEILMRRVEKVRKLIKGEAVGQQ
jgi:hypothetical protein